MQRHVQVASSRMEWSAFGLCLALPLACGSPGTGAAQQFSPTTAHTCSDVLLDDTEREVGVNIAFSTSAAEHLREMKHDANEVIAAFMRDYSCLTRSRIKATTVGPAQLTLDAIHGEFTVTFDKSSVLPALDRSWFLLGCSMSNYSRKYIEYRAIRSPVQEASARLLNGDYRLAVAPEHLRRSVFSAPRIQCQNFTPEKFLLEPDWDRTQTNVCENRVAAAASAFAKDYNVVIVEALKREKYVSCVLN
jgi:hypothetical protein